MGEGVIRLGLIHSQAVWEVCSGVVKQSAVVFSAIYIPFLPASARLDHSYCRATRLANYPQLTLNSVMPIALIQNTKKQSTLQFS